MAKEDDGKPADQQDVTTQELTTPTGEPYRTGDVAEGDADQDPDVQALEAARREAETDPSADGASTDGDGQPAAADQGDGGKPAQPQQQPKPEGAPAAGDGKAGEGGGEQPQPMIPLPRFRDVLSERDTAIQQANYWKGRAEAIAEQARQRPADGGEQNRKQGPTVDEQIAALEAEVDRLDQDYDAGKITSTADHRRQVRQVEAKINQLRQSQQQPDQHRQQQQPAPSGPSLGDEEVLQRQAADLTQHHPYIDHMSQPEINRLVAMAYADAQASNQPIEAGTTRGTYRLRDMVAKLSDAFGPQWHPEVKIERPSQPNPQPAPTPGQAQPGTKPLSPEAQARLEKLNRAEGMPPDANNMGTGANAPQPLSQQRIEDMDALDLEELPGPERQKLLSIYG